MTADQPEKHLLVIIPAFDEAQNLNVVLPKLRDVQHLVRSYGVVLNALVVVSNHDFETKSCQLIEEFGFQHIRRTPTDSFGDAIRTGFANVDSRIDYVVTMDADGSHDPRSIIQMIPLIENTSVVVASRYVAGGSTANPWILIAMSRALNFIFQRVTGISCRDISTNFKMYHARDIRGLELRSRDFDIVEEILIRIRHNRADQFQVIEIPVHFAARHHGETKRQLTPFIASYIITIFRYRFERR